MPRLSEEDREKMMKLLADDDAERTEESEKTDTGNHSDQAGDDDIEMVVFRGTPHQFLAAFGASPAADRSSDETGEKKDAEDNADQGDNADEPTPRKSRSKFFG